MMLLLTEKAVLLLWLQVGRVWGHVYEFLDVSLDVLDRNEECWFALQVVHYRTFLSPLLRFLLRRLLRKKH